MPVAGTASTLLKHHSEPRRFIFSEPKDKLPKARKLCCTNSDCNSRGLDEGRVAALNMILKFLGGKDFKLQGKKVDPKAYQGMVESKLKG